MKRLTVFLLLLALAPDAAAQTGRIAETAGLVPLESAARSPQGALSARISVHVEAGTLDAALREVTRLSGVAVIFGTELAASVQVAPRRLENVTAAEALLHLLRGTSLEGSVTEDGKVVIRRTRETPSTVRQINSQTVRGFVFDRVTRQPLPGANIILAGSDPLIGTTTDLDGRFVLERVPLGRHDFRVSFLGYEPAVINGVIVSSGRETVLEIPLRETVVSAEEVLITPRLQRGDAINDMAAVSARSFTVEESQRYAGGLNDPGRMATAFAGVGGVGPESNALVIRGNAPKGVLWRLEGVEIPNPNHFGGLTVAGGGGLTIFSAQLLDNSDFLTGAFPAEYGNALAGVFDMSLRSGNARRREYAAQIGLQGIDVGAEGPFALGSPSTYLFNYRYSTLALIMPLLPMGSDVIRYQDLSFKLAFPTGRWGRFDVWGVGGLDHQQMYGDEDPSAWSTLWDRSNFSLDLAVGAAGASHGLILGSQTHLQSTVAATINSVRYDHARMDDSVVLQGYLRMRNTSSRVIFGSQLNHRFAAAHTNRSGVSIHQLLYDLNLRAAPDFRPPLIPIADGSGGSTLLQAYTQSRVGVAPGLTATAGVHAQHFALTGCTSAEPRAALTLRAGERLHLNAGYGLHSQIEDVRIYFIEQDATGGTVRPNAGLGFTRAHHAVAGFELRTGESSRLKLEGYYQYLFDVPVIADSSFSMLNFEQDWTFNEALVNDGLGENYGVEATMERFIRGGFYYLVTGSVFRSLYRGGDGLWRGTRFDQRYIADALAGREFTLGRDLLGLNGRLTLQGGQRRSPIDVAASLARGDVVLDEYRAFEERKPDNLFVDVGFTYRMNRRGVSHVWSLQVKNLLGSQIEYPSFNYVTGTVEQRGEGFVLPEIGYRLEF